MARILLGEPFLGGSHRAWAEGWASHSRHDIEILGHEGRHWRWRMRGGRCRWLGTSLRPRAHPSMWSWRPTCSTSLRSAAWSSCPSNVGAVPPREPADLSPSARRVPRYRARGMQWRSLVVADEIWCNSAFQRDELIAGLDRLLASRSITGMSPNGRRSRPNCASSTPVSTFASGDLDRRARHVRSWCRTSGGTTTRMWVRSSERSGDSSSAGSI